MDPLERISESLSEQQRDALLLSGHSLITAGAGAGKTQTLTALVCRDLLVDNILPQNILVCTFTRAAAAQLINRINLQLNQLGHNDIDLSRMWVGTIDAISSRLVREAALKIDISPGFRVADEREMWPLRLDILNQAIENLNEQDLNNLSLLGDISNLNFKKQLLWSLDEIRAAGKDPLSLNIIKPEQLKTDDLIVQIDAITDKIQQAPLTEKQTDNLLGQFNKDREAILTENTDEFSKQTYGKVAKNQELLYEDISNLGNKIRIFKERLIDIQSFPLIEALVSLWADYQQGINDLKRDKELLDIIDLSQLAKRLLIDDHNPGIQRIYLDEAQDTNQQQLAILQGLGSDNFQISVGDPNQSIYGFRHANVESFRQLMQEAEQRVSLTNNYRSNPEIINFINTLSSLIPSLKQDLVLMEPGRDKYEETGEIEILVLSAAGKTGPTAKQEATASLSGIDEMRKRLGLNYRDVCILCRANEVAENYAGALREANIPVLLIQKKGLAAREECKDLIAYLQIIQNPQNQEAWLRVLTSPFIAADDEQILALAASSDNLADNIPKAFPSFAAKHQLILDQINTLRPSQLAALIIQVHKIDVLLNILDATGGQLRNVEKLIQSMIKTETTIDGTSLQTLLERFVKEEEGGVDEGQDTSLPHDLDAVRVMTVHQAKGDEFPLVVIARASKQGPAETRPFLITPNGDININKGGHLASIEKERRAQMDLEEEKRLLYVAITRAQQGLIIVASCSTNQNGAASWRGPAKWLMSETLNIDTPPEVRSEKQINLKTGNNETQIVLRGLDPLTCLDPKTDEAKIDNTALIPLSSQTNQMSLNPVLESISYTSLSNFRRCGLRRHLEQDLNLREERTKDNKPVNEDEQNYVKEKSRETGVLVHELLAEINWHDRKNYLTIAQKTENEKASQLILEAGESEIARRLAQADILGQERRFSLSLGNYLITGIIDLLASDDDGLFIIDWKTGSEQEIFADDYLMQQKIYSLAALRATNLSVEAKWFNLETQLETNLITNLDQMEQLEKELIEDIDNILNQEIKPAYSKESPFCAGCPGLTRICPISMNKN